MSGSTIIEWAKVAERSGFSSVGVAERLVYDSADAVVSLAAAAAVTERVGLLANIFVAPVRPPAVFAKEVATLSRLAPGRLTIGVAGGARPQDHAAANVPWRRRGRLLDESLEALAALAAPENPPHSVGPVPDDALQILVGGASEAALRRIGPFRQRLHRGRDPTEFMVHGIAARQAWREAGRDGEPRIVAGTWYSSEERYGDASTWLDTYTARRWPAGVRCAPRSSRAARPSSSRSTRMPRSAPTRRSFFGCVDDVAELRWLADVVGDRLTPA